MDRQDARLIGLDDLPRGILVRSFRPETETVGAVVSIVNGIGTVLSGVCDLRGE